MRNIGLGGGAASVLLVGLNNESLGMIRETLAAEASLPNQSIGFGDALEIIRADKPDVVIVGYTDAIDASLELAPELIREAPNVTLVALADRADSTAILSAMRVGYKEFVVLPADAARLREVVKSAANSADDDDDKGTVVALLGAKGGVGTSVLTTNLCTELAAIHTVICIDFDFGMGDVASLLDIKTRDTIADLLPRADRLDERALTSAAAVHKSKVHVLPVPDTVGLLGDTNPEELYALLNTAAKGYHFVFIDCGMYSDDAVALACQAADTIVLITTPDVTSVRDAFRRLRMLKALDIPLHNVKLVVNRYHKGAYLTLDQITESLGIPVAATVVDDPRTVDQAVNEGKLIRDINKRSDVARDIFNLVAVLTEDVVDPDGNPPEEEQKSWIGRLFGS